MFIHLSLPGSELGLRLTLNVEEYEHVAGISTDSGVKVLHRT